MKILKRLLYIICLPLFVIFIPIGFVLFGLKYFDYFDIDL